MADSSALHVESDRLDRRRDGDSAVTRAQTPLRVLLADRAGSARAAIAGLLRGLPGVVLVDEIGDLGELGPALRRTRPDVALIDDRLLRDAGHAGIGPHEAGLRVIVLGVDLDPAYAARARRLGAEAWVAKDRAGDRLPALLAR
jgi:DNA-binding NarL/FixJ family response regulator